MAENEDIDYHVSDHATPEPDNKEDDDQPNKSVLLEVRKYLDEQIKKHNTFDVIAPEAEGVMTTQQQVEMHKQVVTHLRNIKTMVNDKIKELA